MGGFLCKPFVFPSARKARWPRLARKRGFRLESATVVGAGFPTYFWKLPPSAAGGDGQGEGEPGPPRRGRKRTKSPNRKCSQGVINTRTLASHLLLRNCQKMRLKYEIADLHFYCPQNLHNYPTNQSFVMTTGPILNPESHYRVPFPLEAHISDAKRPNGTPDDKTWTCSPPHSERAIGFRIVAGNWLY